MCVLSASLLVILVSGHFLFSIALIRENEEVRMISASDWPIHGPWIVSVDYGTNEEFIERARKKYLSAQRKKTANEASGEDNAREFVVKNSFVDFTGMNAVVMEGLRKDELETLSEVVNVYPDLPVYLTAAYSWGIDRIDQPSLPLNNMYTPAFKGCGADIYVIDTGIDTNHFEFTPVVGSINFRTVSNIFNQFGDLSSNIDGHGHGTHCAGIAGGNTIGTAPCSNIYGLKVFDDNGSNGYSSSIISALNVVKQRHLANPNAKSVVSMSLSGYCDSLCAGNPVNQLISSLHDVGILFSVSAGNNGGSDACSYVPASASDAITVAASDQQDNLARYSNVGSCVDIIAPGTAVNSACTNGVGPRACLDDRSYKVLSGTSMSAPHVAGVLAQLLEKHQTSFNSSPDSVKSALLCDAAQNKIQGVPLGPTPNLLVQIPKDHNLNKCLPTAAPSLRPTVLPTATWQPVAPSMSPTGPSQRPSTMQPSIVPSLTPTLAPTACLKIGGTSVANSAYKDDKTIVNVCLTSTVTRIGDSSFASSSLTAISISTTVVSIGKAAFAGADILTAVIPSSVTFIGENAFSSAAALYSILLPTSLIEIPAMGFFGCGKLTYIMIPNSVLSIARYAFGSSGLVNVTVPSSVTSIHEVTLTSVFSYASDLRYVYLPTSLSEMFTKSFYACGKLTSIIIPTSIGRIGYYAFAYSGLLSVVVPTSVTYLDSTAFIGTPAFIPMPTAIPTTCPSMKISMKPSTLPTLSPTERPSQLSLIPSRKPTACPSKKPSIQPTIAISYKPSRRPSPKPSLGPTRRPTVKPSAKITGSPTRRPSTITPTRRPSSRSTTSPTMKPTTRIVKLL